MPLAYRIDVARGVVFTYGSGVLTDEDVLGFKNRLAKDPDFRPDMVELSDIRDVVELRVTPAGIARMLDADRREERTRGARLAILASDDLAYGMARMYAQRATIQEEDPRVGIFRNEAEARAWLGLTDDAPGDPERPDTT